MKDITIAAPFVRQSLEGAAAAGYDIKRFLKECGISPALLEEDQARVALDNFILLQRRLMKVMNDESLGLFERPMRLGTFDLIAHATLHCRTVGEALERMCHYNNLLDTGFIHHIREHEQTLVYRFQRRHPGAVKNNYIATSSLMTVHRFLCWLCATRVPLVNASLDYPPQESVAEYRYIFYGFQVTFNQKYLSLSFHKQDMSLAIQQDLASLRTYLARAPRNIYTPQENLSHSTQVRSEILRTIQNKGGVPTMNEVAERLSIHPQTLRRRLKAESTDFTLIRTQSRRDVAIHMLSRYDVHIEDISEQLGFSEPSAFVRAFKQWMGMTPMAYRRL